MKLNYKDFNEMSDKQLCKLPGVGKTTVARIIGFRPFRTNDDLFRVKGLGKKTLEKLGIEKIYFTNREMKFSYIINLEVDRHFENDDYEVQLINQVCQERGHKCLVVPVEDSYWRDLVY